MDQPTSSQNWCHGTTELVNPEAQGLVPGHLSLLRAVAQTVKDGQLVAVSCRGLQRVWIPLQGLLLQVRCKVNMRVWVEHPIKGKGTEVQ